MGPHQSPVQSNTPQCKQGTHSKIFLTPDGKKLIKKIVVIDNTGAAIRAHREVSVLKNLKGAHKHLISVIDVIAKKTIVPIEIENYERYRPEKSSGIQIEYKIVLPYYRGGTLEAYLKLQTPTVSKAIDIFRQVLMGLACLHQQGFVHGAIKPDNIVFDDEGNIKLIDFGDIEPMGVRSVTSVDDLQFRHRPFITDEIKQYNVFRNFTAKKMPENLIGLLALFKRLFKPTALSTDFYKEMLRLFHARNPDYIEELLHHPFLQMSIRDQLEKIYNKKHLAKQVKKRDLLDAVTQLTPAAKLSELTTHSLLKKPPQGFQSLGIEFALHKVTSAELKDQAEELKKFQQHLRDHPRSADLKTAAQLAKEVYNLAKYNTDPKQPVQLYMKSSGDTLFHQKYHQWMNLKIHSDEKSSNPLIPKMPRVYIAIEPVAKNNRRKVVIVFMGAEVMPVPLESWWTNHCEGQDDIWGKVNFVTSLNQHTGIKAYAYRLLERVKAEFRKVFSSEEMDMLDFELIGHSTGGVLAILLATDLMAMAPRSTTHVIGFGTPSFMNEVECKTLADQFRNDARRSFFNLSAYDDASIDLYGECFRQPRHTIFVKPKDFKGDSFRGVYAASAGTTKQGIKNHSIKRYQTLIEEVCDNKNAIRAKL